jgi:hypothetical protein
VSQTIKTSNLDRLFSQYVRARAGYRCERCGEKHASNSTGLHCSHIWSRRHVGTRWHPNNAVAHCMGCHSYLGGNPVLFTEWAEGYLGADTMQAIREEAMAVQKLTEADKRGIADELYRRVQELGETPVCTGYGRAKKKAAKKRASRKVSQGKWRKKVDGTVVRRETEA